MYVLYGIHDSFDYIDDNADDDTYNDKDDDAYYDDDDGAYDGVDVMIMMRIIYENDDEILR